MTASRSTIVQDCAFESDRLLVGEWHSLRTATLDPVSLPQTVGEMLTSRVTKSLPPAWHGEYSLERARSWIAERDEEGTTLLALDRRSGKAIGLIILFETPDPTDAEQVELRLGYLLSESAWGRGYATEMLTGLVDWCARQPVLSAIVGGVEQGNRGSRRVLEKLGFRLAHSTAEENIFELRLRPVQSAPLDLEPTATTQWEEETMAQTQPTIMLIVRGLKSDLPYSELEKRYKDRMPLFRDVPGLVQKYYSHDESTGELAGIYLWDSQESLDAYLESDLRKTIPTAYELTGPPTIESYPIVDILRS